MGERVFRSTYKGHMDKTKVRGLKQGRKMGLAGVRVVWLGVNADNCN